MINRPYYLSAKYLAILESRHGVGFTAFARNRAVAIHGTGDLHVAHLPSLITTWRERPPVQPVIPAATARPKSLPVPADQWPRWARWLHKRRQSGDRGTGDTLARILDSRGGASFKRWYKAITGHECGCGDRQARLNAQYPYL